MDNPTLHELLDFFGEIFQRAVLPEGSVLLVGAVSYLHGVGVSIYTREWTQVVGKVADRWPSIRLGPLIPIIREEVPGGVTRDLLELVSWFSRMYNGIQGMADNWNLVANKVVSNSAGVTILEKVEKYTIALPSSLGHLSHMEPCAVYNNISRPSSLAGFDKGQMCEVLASLATVLSRDFRIPISIGGIPENAVQAKRDKGRITKLILVGASNLRRTAVHLASQGYEIIDMCTPGWMATPGSIEVLVGKLKVHAGTENFAIILDLFGNSTYRYELYDGSTSLPYKGGGVHHLAGSVHVCDEKIFAKLIEIAGPLFDLWPDCLRIVVPPQPRYLFNGCCVDPSHCTNIGKDSYTDKLLGAVIGLRALLKKVLSRRLAGNFRIVDSCCAILKAADMQIKDRVLALQPLMADDNVHLSSEGYKNCASNIDHAVTFAQARRNTPRLQNRPNFLSVSGQKRFHWRGFTSPVGATSKVSGRASLIKSPRDRPHKSLPYSRGGGGGGIWKNR
jgi:hypothetical protein